VRRAQPEARAELFRTYAPQVRKILSLQGMCDDLDDGVQEVFVKVFRAKLPGEEVFLGWFYRVIPNTGRDLGRRRRSRQGLMQRLMSVAPARATATPAHDLAHVGDAVLREALRSLGTEFREVVALRFFADFSLEEIAGCLDVPVGTVKSRLHTAMARLRTHLVAAGDRR
jgi:RNA polymerase sigma-70 factor, ECF subfamily